MSDLLDRTVKHMNVLFFLICGGCATLVSRVLLGKKKIDLSFFLESVYNTLLVFILCYLVFFSTDRMHIYTDAGIYPQFVFGKTVLLFSVVLSFLLGIIQAKQSSKPVSQTKKASFLPVHLILNIFLVILLIFTFAYFWSKNTYQNITLEMLMFYLIMPLQGTSRSFGMEIFVYVVLPTLFLFLLGLLLSVFPFSQTKGHRLSNIQAFCLHQKPFYIPIRVLAPVLMVWLIVLYHYGDAFLDISGFLQSRLNGSTFIEDNYISPASVSLTFPEKKRNLITLYIESCESTSQDVENGGVFPVNYIQDLTRLEKENISFSQNNLFAGAAVAPACGWTMAGLIAQSAGIPLKYYDINSNTIDQMGSDFIQFMPGVISLGDILQSNGYHNVFLAGSDFTFGGRTQYYSQHGNYEILDLIKAKQLNIQGSTDAAGWGMLDKDLYAWAKDELLKLAADGSPFHFAMLTLDTHYPVHTCDRCPDEFSSPEEKAIACSSEQAYEFVRWCQEQTFYENTTIVITGDHASMIEGFYDAAAGKTYDKYYGEQKRLVYNVFINPTATPSQEKNRLFTTIDFFPTVLASIGVQISGEQLALGVNLFSDKQTLSERYGYDEFFSGLNHKSVFYDMNLLYP